MIGTLEEIIDDDHAIVSTSGGGENYVSIMSFVDKDLLEPGCSVLLNNKSHAVIGVLADDADPMVNVMKLEKAPTESYADIGGLEQQIQEIKVCPSPTSSKLDHRLTRCSLRNRSSCRSLIQNCTKRWESGRPRVSSCMVFPELGKPCSPKRSQIKLRPRFCGSWAAS